MNSPLIKFTFILDYLANLYISQVYAIDLDAAFDEWYSLLKANKDLHKPYEAEILEGFSNNNNGTPILVKELDKVWCATALVNGDIAILNIIE